MLLDDLDRLEPAQAVEVIRLVKSVGTFSLSLPSLYCAYPLL